jgi:hypothetical protein
VEEAAMDVASFLGRHSVAQIDVIRVEYYNFKPKNLGSFPSQFFSRRAWVFKSTDEVLQLTLGDYKRHFGKPKMRRLAGLFRAVRSDQAQRMRNREWLLEPGAQARTRIESNYWDPIWDWQLLATDLWFLGRLHAGIGEVDEGKTLLERALNIWKVSGTELQDIQVVAIPSLEQEIAVLTSGYKVSI